MMLFAAVSEGATNPESWSRAIERNGFGVVVAAALVAGGLLLGGYIVYRLLSPNGFIERFFSRLDVFLTSLQTTQVTTQTALLGQSAAIAEMREMHISGPCNVNDVRLAGHAAADALGELGKQVGADISDQVAEIHRALRGRQ